MGRRGDRRPKEVMNPGCPSDKRNLRNRLWQAGRDNDADHNGTSSQLPKDLGRVPAAFACSGKAAAYVGLRELRRQPLQKFSQKAPQSPALNSPSTARTAGRSDWAERRFRRQPFILL